MAAKAVFAACTRFLNGHGPRRPAEALRRALDETDEAALADIYGRGPVIEDFEAEIAKLLGTEAAVFMPSGTMAQQIALRIASDHSGHNKRVAMHATSHLELHEQDGLRLLHGLEPQLLANAERLFTLADLQSLQERPAAILWELPQREIGGQLPEWEALQREVQWAREQGIHCHLDGARLWEAAPHYGRPYEEIVGLFDSVYVSFYKGLGGIAGAILAGTDTFVEESRPWLRRHGGNLISLYPYVLSARAGIKRHLGQFDRYRQRSRAIANALSQIDGVNVVPEQPPTQMMHLHIERPAEALNAANEALANETRVMLFGNARPIADGRSLVELSIGDACDSLSDDEVAALFAKLLSS